MRGSSRGRTHNFDVVPLYPIRAAMTVPLALARRPAAIGPQVGARVARSIALRCSHAHAFLQGALHVLPVVRLRVEVRPSFICRNNRPSLVPKLVAVGRFDLVWHARAVILENRPYLALLQRAVGSVAAVLVHRRELHRISHLQAPRRALFDQYERAACVPPFLSVGRFDLLALGGVPALLVPRRELHFVSRHQTALLGESKRIANIPPRVAVGRLDLERLVRAVVLEHSPHLAFLQRARGGVGVLFVPRRELHLISRLGAADQALCVSLLLPAAAPVGGEDDPAGVSAKVRAGVARGLLAVMGDVASRLISPLALVPVVVHIGAGSVLGLHPAAAPVVRGDNV
eukprot:1189511-Prorocentrum_minimum.AAC.2